MWCEGLALEEWEEKYDYNDEVMFYLHGNCDEWVNLNYQDGDTCIAITEYDYNIERICLMHCCLFRNGKYIDIRGETEDFDDVLEAFDYGDFEVEEYDTLKAFNRRMKNLGVR